MCHQSVITIISRLQATHQQRRLRFLTVIMIESLNSNRLLIKEFEEIHWLQEWMSCPENICNCRFTYRKALESLKYIRKALDAVALLSSVELCKWVLKKIEGDWNETMKQRSRRCSEVEYLSRSFSALFVSRKIRFTTQTLRTHRESKDWYMRLV